ncbi:FkbM family methyltransferase [Salisaeta longa]|uniref:FkbM family methyltransferase n=1 Tax=Salisaeta longa TaxID=503170 RepID=UPI0003B62D5E|nr:FkbM family methyltransferase [Salisaeta longa]
MRHPLFWPRVNRTIRHALRPIGSQLPVDWQPRITGTFEVSLDCWHTIQLACNPTSFAAKRLFFEGVEGYEPETFHAVRALAPHADVFFDIGANLGYYTLVAAAYHPTLHIRSFEPLSGAYHFLQRNVRLNALQQVTCVPCALSSGCGHDTFHYTVDPTFAYLEHHLTATGSLDDDASQQYADQRSCTVALDTVDHYKEAEGLATVDLMKLDTEATEHLVLEGAEKTLANDRPVIICEVLPDASGQAVQEILKRHDYTFHQLQRTGGRRRDTIEPSDTTERNYLMVPREDETSTALVQHALAHVQ